MRASQVALVVKNLPANAGDMGLIFESSRFPEGGHGNLCSCVLAWRIPMDRGALQATGHGVTKESDTTEAT